jgi:hypothetical protein
MTPLQWSDLLERKKNDRELHEEAWQYLLRKAKGVVDEGQLAALHRDSVNVPARSMLSRIENMHLFQVINHNMKTKRRTSSHLLANVVS